MNGPGLTFHQGCRISDGYPGGSTFLVDNLKRSPGSPVVETPFQHQVDVTVVSRATLPGFAESQDGSALGDYHRGDAKGVVTRFAFGEHVALGQLGPFGAQRRRLQPTGGNPHHGGPYDGLSHSPARAARFAFRGARAAVGGAESTWHRIIVIVIHGIAFRNPHRPGRTTLPLPAAVPASEHELQHELRGARAGGVGLLSAARLLVIRWPVDVCFPGLGCKEDGPFPYPSTEIVL